MATQSPYLASSLKDKGYTGGNLPGNLGPWGAGLSLVTALQGNDPIAQASAAGAFYNSIGSSANSPVWAMRA